MMLALTSAPFEMNILTISRCPAEAAHMRGVVPFIFLISTSAPSEMSNSAIAIKPFAAVKWSAEVPYPFHESRIQ